MSSEPIYAFQSLKEYLKKKGYHIGEATPWKEIDSEEVRLSTGDLLFDDNRIFIQDEYGVRRQVFLYKRRYHLARYGKPRMHICKCDVIEEFLQGEDIPEYRRANTGTVKVLNWDNFDIEEDISDLPLCSHCARILLNPHYKDSTEFSEVLRRAAEVNESNQDAIKVNSRGYTIDWQQISSAYRKEHNYTCERCGVQVSPFETMFMHVHHKNKIKTDNCSSNLQCLCIKCHSEIDEKHIHNFATPGNRKLLRLFSEKYPMEVPDRCSCCGQSHKNPYWKAHYVCPKCGMEQFLCKACQGDNRHCVKCGEMLPAKT